MFLEKCKRAKLSFGTKTYEAQNGSIKKRSMHLRKGPFQCFNV